MRTKRTIAVALAGALLLPPGASRADAECTGVRPRGTGWTSIALPSFPAADDYQGHPGRVPTAYAVDSQVQDRIYVTNGTTLMLTEDGGCTWRAVWAVPLAPTPETPLTQANFIDEIQVSEGPLPHRVYLLLSIFPPDPTYDPTYLLSLGQPHVVASDDGETGWRSADSGLPPLGGWSALRVAPSSPSTVYLTAQYLIQYDPAGGEGLARQDLFRTFVFVSHDGARAWQQQTDPLSDAQIDVFSHQFPGGPEYTDDAMPWFGFDVNPLRSEELWIWDRQWVFRSLDGGVTWSAFDHRSGLIGTSDLGINRTDGSIWVAPWVGGAFNGTAPCTCLYWSRDQGNSWHGIEVPVPVEAIGLAWDGTMVVLGALGTGAYRLVEDVGLGGVAGWSPITPSYPHPPLRKLVSGATRHYFLTDESIEVFDPSVVADQGVGGACQGKEITLLGTSGADRLVGTSGPDVFAGLGGNDTIDGGAGDDIICGGAGDDVLIGNLGADTLDGGSGSDTLSFTGGTKRVRVNLAAGTSKDAGGVDTVRDVENVSGSQGADMLKGNGSANRLRGNAGADVMRGGPGRDVLLGGAGNDVLDGGGGGARCVGGPGRDRLRRC